MSMKYVACVFHVCSHILPPLTNSFHCCRALNSHFCKNVLLTSVQMNAEVFTNVRVVLWERNKRRMSKLWCVVVDI
ncbi:CLUMA_CG010242, isoform A [Clunio marinus]|uniref:CLUMA_CG010242, isoform A n=1 Tax=Clunio marinus TaxID=568069 RepID=A0A1J1I8X9_9DIPT|nr:CLUMA_CG010242, isoform A [Clunio marinus]